MTVWPFRLVIVPDETKSCAVAIPSCDIAGRAIAQIQNQFVRALLAELSKLFADLFAHARVEFGHAEIGDIAFEPWSRRVSARGTSASVMSISCGSALPRRIAEIFTTGPGVAA